MPHRLTRNPSPLSLIVFWMAAVVFVVVAFTALPSDLAVYSSLASVGIALVQTLRWLLQRRRPLPA